VKVVILGAGLGGLSAAWVLSAPCWANQFEITVYEESWAPGGKAASGRTADRTQRVDEHGLHMLFGTYHHVWWMLKHTYDKTKGNGPFKTLEEAFTPRENIVFTENIEGDWRSWRLPDWIVRRGDVRPWDFYTRPNDPALIGAIIELIRSLAPSFFPEDYTVPLAWTDAEAAQISTWIDNLAGFVRDLNDAVERNSTNDPVWRAYGAIFETWSDWTSPQDEARQLTEMLDLLAATLRGFVVDELWQTVPGAPAGCTFDKINDWDLAEWLALHGSTRSTHSTLLRAFYGGLYAFPGGAEQGSLAAGVGLRAILRVLLDHEGHMVHAMNGGMGEVVIQPVVQLLRDRGVTFKLRHRVESITVTEGVIRRIDLQYDLSAATRAAEFETEVHTATAGTIRSYPSTINSRLDGEGEADLHLHRENPPFQHAKSCSLNNEVDFHHVVLALPPSVLSQLGGNLGQQHRFSSFLATYRTVGTLGVQLWLDSSADDLGWPAQMPVVGAFQRPLDTWADMTQLIQTENWVGAKPKHLAFLTGARPEHVEDMDQDRVLADAETRVTRWLERDAPLLWNVSSSPPRIVRWIVSASTAPSHRYVLSMPGTINDRIEPDGSGISNLSLAGDWVRNGLDCGCAESAVLGGILAAQHALKQREGQVTLEEIRNRIDDVFAPKPSDAPARESEP
jgi:uncharacterized protein with NAD-binding domain and iron-sulfur cluster